MTILIAAIAGLFRGICEGICFVKPCDYMHILKPYHWLNTGHKMSYYDMVDAITNFDMGARGHVWHKKHYIIGLVRDLSLMAFGVLAFRQYVPTYHYLVTLCTALIVIWEFSELGYSYGRYRRWIKPIDENVNWADLKVKIPWYKRQAYSRMDECGEVVWYKYHIRWIQIIPFHAPSIVMHLIRVVMIGGIVWMTLVV